MFYMIVAYSCARKKTLEKNVTIILINCIQRKIGCENIFAEKEEKYNELYNKKEIGCENSIRNNPCFQPTDNNIYR